MGYDRRQVDAFSEEMDAVVDELRDQVRQLTDELEAQRQARPITADQAFANVGRETHRILQSAQEAGARMLRESRAQAESELATARRERAEIVGDGHRARDEMGEQLRRLDEARARLVRQLQQAAAEAGRACAGLEPDPSSPVDVAPHALTGTDEARPRASGATLRVVSGDDRPVRGSRRRDPAPTPTPASDLVVEKRDRLAPIRLTLIERLSDGLHTTRDQLRERVRQLRDGEDEVVVDESTFRALTTAGTIQLRQAFDAGALAAVADRRRTAPAASSDEVGRRLSQALEEVVAAPIRALLSAGTAADEPPWVLAERLDSVISDASEAIVVRIAETELSRAYERGKLATWVAGDVIARRWIVDPRGHRNDEPCRRDAAVGAVVVPEPFPSGEHTPPRQDECTCTTVAADEENST
jgi:HPt (histidine-containing phosphotransfer) domain-containing protein